MGINNRYTRWDEKSAKLYGSGIIGHVRALSDGTVKKETSVVGPTQPEPSVDPELDAYYASKMMPETDTEVTKKKAEVAYLSGESDKPPTSDEETSQEDAIRADPTYSAIKSGIKVELDEYIRAMQDPNLSDEEKQKMTDTLNAAYSTSPYVYQLAWNDYLRGLEKDAQMSLIFDQKIAEDFPMSNAAFSQNVEKDLIDRLYGLASGSGGDGAGTGTGDGTGSGNAAGASSGVTGDGTGNTVRNEGTQGGVPSSDFAAGNIQDWYRHYFGGEFTGDMPSEKPDWMTDGDWLNGQNAYALYRKAQLEDESYNNRLANLESWYNAQISELSGASDAQKQKAAMLYNRLLKYLPVQNRARGISNLGVAQSTGTRALATYMGRLGDIGSQEASSRASLAQSRQNSALSLEEAYGSAKKDRITAENNLLNSRYAQILQNQSDAEKNAAAAAQATSKQILNTLDSYIKQEPAPEALRSAMEAYLNSPYVDEETKRLIREKLQIYMSSYSEEHGDGSGDFSFD